MSWNLVVDSRSGLSPDDDLLRKTEQVISILEAESGKAGYPWCKTLAAILREHTPLSFIVSPSARQIADWLLEFARFLENRRQDAAVRLLPIGAGGHFLLLTNSPDVPYLLDSIQTVLEGLNLRFNLISHPILSVRRKDGALTHLARVEKRGPHESFIVIELEGIMADALPRIEEGVRKTIEAARQVHHDHKALMKTLAGLEQVPGMNDYRDLWRWLQKGNFFPFSYRCLRVEAAGAGEATIREVEGSALGLTPEPPELTCCDGRPLSDFDRDVRERLLRREALVVETIERRSPILRDDSLVWIGFREKDEHEPGSWQEHVFLGLFSQQSIDETASSVPTLHKRIDQALSFLRIPEDSHDYRKSIEIFNNFPKVELFSMAPDELAGAVRSFTLLYRRGAVKVVPARSLAVRGLTLLVIMPREYYAEENMGRIGNYLCRYFKTPSVAAQIIHISDDYLSLHVNIRLREDVRVDIERLERGLTNIARPWKLKLQMLLERELGEQEGGELWEKYSSSFPREYRTMVHPRFALRDIRGLEQVLTTGEEVLDLWGPFAAAEPSYRIQFYSLKGSYLNELMPFLENLNLCVIDEVDFSIKVGGVVVFIKSFAVRGAAEATHRLSSLRENFLGTLTALRRGEVENDYLNRLLVLTGLSCREIDVFRGYRNYYFQLGSPYTKRRVAFALINNPQVALLLFRYFEARFRIEPEWQDPMRREEEALSPIRQELVTALETVADINEDNILRILFNLIDSTVRTNFFLRRNLPDYFSFKISAIGIIDMPAPRPLYEIYVHSASMEGIHLRGGRVARGGIRWSDRPDDFRTEILGLMKTQMTKNALIVPVGSKGGFVVKKPFADREEGAALSRAAYQTLIRGMLDLTDNRVGEEIVRPEGIVAYDEEDPYLVVAADKGTAHLSDTANAISREYDFWLDDAFASGGSQGYDHKKLGITARGAWECVKAHFRELGKDIQTEPFTVTGIGDMSGDVFGNGMLLSRQIRLLAAFDHRHIFLDPDPDPEVSFRERQRLFELPRSSWDDYDRSLISSGGGVFPRHAKSIPLSREVRDWLGVRHETMDGQGLIRLLLMAPVDLLWNGGIGTYVKAAGEKNEDAGDRANDAVRVDAPQLKVRVVGEGGNLGFTQRGRIEYALGGGRINTDAVDNSGGVDCSDHEVNLKIFMQHLKNKGLIGSQEERDRLLEEIADEVCAAVLADNYGQSLCLSLDRIRCADDVEPSLSLTERLSSAGLLDRRGEFLPTSKEVFARKDSSLTRPELAILMAYSKMQLFQALLESALPEQREARVYLFRYFPEAVRNHFGDEIPAHPLAREITATVITNLVVNQGGSTFLNQLARQTGAPLAKIAALYLALDQVLDGEAMRLRIAALDNRVSAGLQQQLLRRLEDTLFSLCSWALVRETGLGLEEEEISAFRERANVYVKNLGGVLPKVEWEQYQKAAASLESEGFSAEIARTAAALPYLEDFLPVETLAVDTDNDLYSAAQTYIEVHEYLGLKDLLRRMEAVQVRDRWDRLALQSLKGEFASAAFNLAHGALQESKGNLESFFAPRRHKLRFYRNMREALGGVPANFHPFTVLLRALVALQDKSS
ncbi:NAD-glutamate dehydrogenase domain-containing protein [Desulfuromonas sp. TF]|uniref:NAD-glutamate dehydrogenase n=1 Tax=Desulfuromonas sp. TF TaxID=1232410 RepID=UPI000409BE5C|nr:NAD-glutamate dehydrogenase domain-containing protein [Desulfuromonas sp. TF]